uniref:Uncharacterized protein n=1 Tax=Caenorhabditis japonica TaxID=281687 RepID=A0A8R1IPJ5_CAEJA
MRELLSGELTYRTATLFLSTAIIVLSIYPATHFCVLPIALLIILINGFYVLCAWKFDMEWLLTAQWCSFILLIFCLFLPTIVPIFVSAWTGSMNLSYIQSRFAILMVEELEIVRRRKFLQKSNKRFQPVNLKAVMTAKTIKDIPNLIPFIEIDHNYSMHSLETFKR